MGCYLTRPSRNEMRGKQSCKYKSAPGIHPWRANSTLWQRYTLHTMPSARCEMENQHISNTRSARTERWFISFRKGVKTSDRLLYLDVMILTLPFVKPHTRISCAPSRVMIIGSLVWLINRSWAHSPKPPSHMFSISASKWACHERILVVLSKWSL